MSIDVKNSVVRLLAVGLILGAVFLAFGALPPKNTIILTSEGFSPRTLTIRAGETVTFTSERGKYFWPASDFHPTHTLFPAFDSKKPVAPSDSWSFTFEKPGTYPFHDHLAAYFFGIIKVEDAHGNVPDDCQALGGKMLCWQNRIFLALAENGVSGAYDTLADLYQSDSEFSVQCHALAHNTGLASYQFYLKDPSFIYSPKAVACAGGFYHGFMEGYLGATGDVKGAAAVCDKIGETLGTSSSDARLQCYHGIGHGSVETTIASTGSFGSEDAFVKDALALCEQASGGKNERYRCYSGVFNAVSNFYINNEYGLSFKKNDPLALCAKQNTVYKEPCYGNMNGAILFKGGMDLTKSAQFIFAMPETAYRASALEYLAMNDALYHEHDASFGEKIGECHAFPDAYRVPCVRGFMRGLIEGGDPGHETAQAEAFCKEPSLTSAERGACSVVLGALKTQN